MSLTCFIPFKAKACLDLKSRKENVEHVDSESIKKHKNDVFRWAQLIAFDPRKRLMENSRGYESVYIMYGNEEVALKALGIKEIDKSMIIQFLHQCYRLDLE